MLCSLQCPLSKENPEEGQRSSEAKGGLSGASGSAVILRNKAPRWHDHLQCWCLNFHGRVTVASVKNFQLVEGTASCQPRRDQAEEDTILQFGKVGDDLFTMDFRHPLSAFQAFAICLTSFGTKLACEWDSASLFLSLYYFSLFCIGINNWGIYLYQNHVLGPPMD